MRKTIILKLDMSNQQKEKSSKSRHKNQIHLFSQSGVRQKYYANSYNIYTEDLLHSPVGPVLAASDYESLYVPCSVDSEGLLFLVSSTLWF